MIRRHDEQEEKKNDLGAVSATEDDSVPCSVPADAATARHTPPPFYVSHGMIFTTGDPYGHGQMRIADIRGWGHLTGQGACRFSEDKAAAIQDATAEFIVRACNSHDELMEALRDTLRLLTNTSGFDHGATAKWHQARVLAVQDADAALAKAEPQ